MSTFTAQMTWKEAQAVAVRIKHPDLDEMYPCGVNDLPVAVFQRQRYKPLTPEASAAYDRDRAIVEAHGGRMVKAKWELAGENAPFTKAECDEMVAAVVAVLTPEVWQVVETWNGEGCYTFSVSVRLRHSGRQLG